MEREMGGQEELDGGERVRRYLKKKKKLERNKAICFFFLSLNSKACTKKNQRS